jgi:hypothetical protein
MFRARFRLLLSLFSLGLALAQLACLAQQAPNAIDPPPSYGPWNAAILSGGEGINQSLVVNDPILAAGAPWTLLAWINAAEVPSAPQLVAGMGAPDEEFPRYLAIAPGKAMLYMGDGNALEGAAALSPDAWHLLVATFDGKEFRLFADGAQMAEGPLLEREGAATSAAATQLLSGSVGPIIEIAPSSQTGFQHFGGKIYGLKVLREALAPGSIREMAQSHPDFSLPVYEEGSKPWPVQTRGQAGYRAPQDPAEMPHSKAPFQEARAIPAESGPALVAAGDNLWRIDGGWYLLPAPEIDAEGAQISTHGYSVRKWYEAVVPGTVLTTLVDRGVYPDPYYGLNNLAIPETLNKQDYWYRTEFRAPAATSGKRLTLTFEGINYKASVWLNGQPLGTITGAFIRGAFDVTKILHPGVENALAIRVSPPPHPGIPQEQSIKGGPGENGGLMCLDGPTFVATEGWDWIPAIRDRDTGIWQPVTLRATSEVRIGDPRVVTTLPLPDTSRASVDIAVPLVNTSGRPEHVKLTAAFEDVTVTKEVDLKPGENTVQLAPADFPQLNLRHPRLWWPNGYGPANLYHLKLSVTSGGSASDTKELRFGIREITYELSLLNSAGHLTRVEFSPTSALDAGEALPAIDNTHQGIRSIPAPDPIPPEFPAAWRANWRSWVESLTQAGEHSAAIMPSDDLGTSPYLVIKVNGVRIACRGGNWGMDDAMKRVSRAHLEPFFRLHRDAHENIIRNWVGQSTEETFYDLADEYGFLVWNDFWETTQNYNIEAQDPELFLNNARDVILRFRNHPSIAVWCGRNEGVPQPIINEGLANLVQSLDGTRYYSPSSNQIELQNSGPYRYQNPKNYFTTLNRGFSVETGTPSMSTLESFEAAVPKPDQWPMDDVWAYHDWHFQGNGDSHPFVAEMQAEFGAPTSLEDFERKAQMMDYVDHRAIFEGMNAHLWSPNSGRLLWMTQPAWPSNMWEVLSSDYDTQSSFYGEMKACEPLHIQLDLASDDVEVVNTTTSAPGPLKATADVYSLTNQLLLHREASVSVGVNAETPAMHLELTPLEKNGVIFVKLQLKNTNGIAVSQNLYWQAGESSDYRQLAHLGDATVTAAMSSSRTGEMTHIQVELKNTGPEAALQNKLTLIDGASGERILPAYYSDNYVSLLPGESRTIEIDCPAGNADGSQLALTLRGFNLPQRRIELKTTR